MALVSAFVLLLVVLMIGVAYLITTIALLLANSSATSGLVISL